MPDLLDPLERLRDATLTQPEPLESLRRRVTRRRRRQRAVLAVGGAVVVGAMSLVAIDAVRDREDQGLFMNEGSIAETRPPTTNVALTIYDEVSIGELPGPFVRVLAHPRGIWVAPSEGAFRRLSDHPASIAFGVGPRRVVAQYDPADVQEQYDASDVPIVVLDDGGERVIEPPSIVDAGGGIRLDDAGFVDGHPVAVVSAWGGANREQWDERLYLVDLDTLEKTDLGTIGQWEFGSFDARLVPEGVVVGRVRMGPGALEIELRRFDGSTAWSRSVEPWPPHDGGSQSIAIYRYRAEPPSGVLLVETASDLSGPEPETELVVRHFDLGTGREAPDATPVRLRPAPDLAEVPHTCAPARHADPTSLLCAQPLGPPFYVDYATGDAYPVTGAPSEGVMTIWRTG